MTRRLSLFLLVLGLGACGGSDRIAGGASDLPGPVPADVKLAGPPTSAPAAPDFPAVLVDGTPLRASELWRDRPVVLVFAASYCDRCADLHRQAAAAVDRQQGAVALLGVVADDDAGAARGYAADVDLGHPVAVASERVWLNYAAREPGLVVLVSRGGRVLRGWPGGTTAEELAAALAELVER